MKTLQALTEQLILERKKRKLTQKDMYMLIGMSQQQYQRMESGKDFKISTLMRILAGLNLELTFSKTNYATDNREVESDSQSTEKNNFWLEKNQHLEDE